MRHLLKQPEPDYCHILIWGVNKKHIQGKNINPQCLQEIDANQSHLLAQSGKNNKSHFQIVTFIQVKQILELQSPTPKTCD